MISLSLSLAKANFKLRNEGSYLGFFWYLLNPLALFLAILLIREHASFGSNIEHYPLYLLVGLLMYNFFSQTIGASYGLIAQNANFIKSIRIPEEAIVLSRVLQAVFSHLFEVAILLVSALYFGINPIAIFIYLAIFVVFAIFVLGLCFAAAVFGLFASDLSNVWIAVSQILFFVTPVFYEPISGSLLSKINTWNPLYYFLEVARSPFIYDKFPFTTLALISVASFVSFFVGLYIFRKGKWQFAELV